MFRSVGVVAPQSEFTTLRLTFSKTRFKTIRTGIREIFAIIAVWLSCYCVLFG